MAALERIEMLEIVPVTRDDAFAFVRRFHRHHPPPVSHKFSIAAAYRAADEASRIVGVIVVGRPVARALDDGWTLEVTRCCTDGTLAAHNAASMLYATAWRAARAMGYRRLVTYTLADELGVSLVAAGWRVVHQTKGGSWNCASRPRVDKHPLGAKTLWEITAG